MAVWLVRTSKSGGEEDSAIELGFKRRLKNTVV